MWGCNMHYFWGLCIWRHPGGEGKVFSNLLWLCLESEEWLGEKRPEDMLYQTGSWTLTSARSPEMSYLMAPLELVLCLPWEAACKLPRSRGLGGYDLGVSPFLGRVRNGCWGETVCTVGWDFFSQVSLFFQQGCQTCFPKAWIACVPIK